MGAHLGMRPVFVARLQRVDQFAVVAHGLSKSVAPIPLYHALALGALRRAEGRARQLPRALPPP